MLLVKTVVKPSPIAGVGLFADEDIPTGEKVWKFSSQTCLLLTRAQFQCFYDSFHKTEEIIKYFLTYLYCEDILEGAVLCLDNTRFMNHAPTPSLDLSEERDPATGIEYAIAAKDICRGDELTGNYRTFCSDDWLKNFRIHHAIPFS